MKSYHTEEMSWTEEGTEFSMELGRVLKPLIEAEFDKGYSPAEILEMVVLEATSTLCQKRIMHRINYRKKDLTSD